MKKKSCKNISEQKKKRILNTSIKMSDIIQRINTLYSKIFLNWTRREQIIFDDQELCDNDTITLYIKRRKFICEHYATASILLSDDMRNT